MNVPSNRHEAAARHLLRQVRARATMCRAIGIVQVQRGCGPEEARDQLEQLACDVEATRMVTLVNAAAESRADPDVHWG
ncbi:hypothetical protein AB0C24_29540 [Amycolatopsis japonica]|uniref:ANTAR domain-containing protein n=1 Tax=Amycolatopsis japonica TaxID=208439 RepID=UPI0033F42D57